MCKARMTVVLPVSGWGNTTGTRKKHEVQRRSYCCLHSRDRCLLPRDGRDRHAAPLGALCTQAQMDREDAGLQWLERCPRHRPRTWWSSRRHPPHRHESICDEARVSVVTTQIGILWLTQAGIAGLGCLCLRFLVCKDKHMSNSDHTYNLLPGDVILLLWGNIVILDSFPINGYIRYIEVRTNNYESQSYCIQQSKIETLNYISREIIYEYPTRIRYTIRVDEP